MLRLKNLRKNVHENIRTNRRVFILYSVLRTLVILAMIRAIFNGNYNGAMICLLSLGLFLLPSLMEDSLNIHIPPLLEGIIYVFIFAAEILGELAHFYVAVPGWDTALHTVNGFLAAAVGFSLIELLNRSSRHVRLSPFYLSLVAFCFSMTIGVLWEFFEFAADALLRMDMQKDFIVTSINSVTLDPSHTQEVVHINDITQTQILTADGSVYTIEGGYLDIGIGDTMKDLFVNFIGALVFSSAGYLALRYHDRHDKGQQAKSLISGLVPRPQAEQENDENYSFNNGGFTADEK